jgi:predicted ATPase
MIHTLAAYNYRSLREFIAPLAQLTVISGSNGSGKSNLYRALRLLAETARGGMMASLAREGGFGSALWAGPVQFSKAMKRGEQAIEGSGRQVALRLGFYSEDFGYAIDLGMPVPVPGSHFGNDPEIKNESIWHGPKLKPGSLLVERRNSLVRIRRDRGWEVISSRMQASDSMLEIIADPLRAPEVMNLREQIRSWRFYDQFRTDADAPARQPRVGTRTPVLSADGADLAAALQTILEVGDAEALKQSVSDAFPGAQIHVDSPDGRFLLSMKQDGLLRPVSVAEWSDGTLRYLLLCAVLLTPRPPQLMVLNEPESSLHPDLLPALARLIGVAARQSQTVVVSHNSRLIALLEDEQTCKALRLEKELGETRILGQLPLETPPWAWASR